MGWLVLMVLLTIFGAAGVVANVNQLRWQRRVAREMHSLAALKPSTALRPAIAELPPPVARYRELAVGDRAPVHTLKLRHGGRYVTWSAIDARHATRTLRFGELEVSGTFEFGADGLPVSINAERFMDGQGLRSWGGTYHDFRELSGM